MLTPTSKSNVLHLKKYVTKNNIKLGKPTGKTGYIKKKITLMQFTNFL